LYSNVFITGGTGFLGAYIIRELVEKGYVVRALRRPGSGLPFFISAELLNRVEWVEGDVLDVVSLENALEGRDAVIHAAAMVSFRSNEKKEMYRVNVEGTANVVNAAIEKNISRFVHISSVAALGRQEDGGMVNEEKKWEDNAINTHYARSKHKAEMEVWRGFGEGLDVILVNPSTVLGFGNWNNSSCAVFKKVYDGFPWYSTGINGFVDVEDVAKATVLLMESPYSGERFIVNGDNWPFKKLLDTMAENFGKKKPSRAITPFILSLAWRLEKLRSFFTSHKPLLTKESAKVALSKTCFDNEKILKSLPGFSFTPLEESIQKACKKYLQAAANMPR
jgi:dihydroflavonol-4-reductase